MAAKAKKKPIPWLHGHFHAGTPGTGKSHAVPKGTLTGVLTTSDWHIGETTTRPVSLDDLLNLLPKVKKVYRSTHPNPERELDTQAEKLPHCIILETPENDLLVHFRLDKHCMFETREHQQTAHTWQAHQLWNRVGQPVAFLPPVPQKDVTKTVAAIQANRQWFLRKLHAQFPPHPTQFDPFDL
jgi:hypothetical protein